MIAEKKTILIGVAGGIAAYKMVGCASRLTQAGHAVRVAMSPGALEFVRPLSFAAVTGNAVLDTIFPRTADNNDHDLFPHIYPAADADMFILAPASADMIAKIAHGLADDPVCASVLALSDGCKKLFCPAMHVNMWAQGIVRENAAELERRGWVQVGPESGKLACGSVGVGRMAEPEMIVARALESLAE